MRPWKPETGEIAAPAANAGHTPVFQSFRVAAVVLVLFLATAPSAFSEGSITVSVESSQVTLNEPFAITIEVQGDQIGDLVFPKSGAVVISPDPIGSSMSQQITYDNGTLNRRTVQTLVYSATATVEGEITLDPITAAIDGREVKSAPLELIVGKSASRPPLPNRTPLQRPSPSARGAAATPTLDDAVRLQGSVDKEEVFQGEPVELLVRVMVLDNVNVSVNSRPQIDMPTTEGFFAGPIQQTALDDVVNGWPYKVTELRQPLFPTGVGEYALGAAHWEASVRAVTQQGLRREMKQLSTDPLVVKVKPLPDRPEGFSGAVGAFEVRAGLRDDTVMQGVPTVLDIRVSGRGNPNAISPPKLPEMKWAQVSAPEEETEHDSRDWTRVTKAFHYSITPLQTGDFETPAFNFIYFDPDKAAFATEQIPALPVRVTASGEGQRLVAMGGSNGGEQREVQILGQDLLPAVTAAPGLRAVRPARVATGLAVGAPPLLFFGFYLIVRRRRQLENNPAYARSYFARSKSKKRLTHLAHSKEPGDDLYRAVAGYLADKFNANETGMTPQDAEELMKARGVDPALQESFARILRTCERRRYTGVAFNPDEVQALAQAAATAMDKLDAQGAR